MTNIRKGLAALALLAGTVAAPAAGAAPMLHGIDRAAMDTKVLPGQDFDAYANGGWEKTTKIPADRAGWSSFSVLYEIAAKRTRGLIEGAAAGKIQSPDAQKIGDYYSSFMDEAAIDKKGLAPLKPELDAIAAIHDAKSLAHVLGSDLRADVDPLNNTNFWTENLFGIWTAPGFTDSAHYTPYFLQGGLGLPNREFYLSKNPKMAAIREAYQAHIAKVLELAGIADAKSKADAIFALEMKIAKVQWSIVDSQDVVKNNNPWAATAFAKKAPGIDWSTYFAAAGLGHQKRFIVWQPSAITAIAKIVGEAPLSVMQSYLAFHQLNHYSGYLPKAFADERFAFYGKALSGTPEQSPRWKRAVSVTNVALGDAIGRLYAARYFTPAAKAEAKAMVANIIAAFGKRIDALNWMSPQTKAKAKAKLAVLYVGVGYPDKWKDYSALTVVRGDALGNYRRWEAFKLHNAIARLGKPVDRTEWSMTPQTVNAVNLPLQNALNFPAAILKPPFFDPEAGAAYNYGAIGAIIGHEISHSFDDQGAMFDSEGRLRDWWTKADFAHFHAAGDVLAKQYDGYKPFPDLAVNGQQTLGENIADLAGLTAAYDGWKASLNGKPAAMWHGFTGDQVFFIAYGQAHRSLARPAALRQQVLTDVHAPGRYRSDTVRNVDAWYKAFDVKPGAALYLKPDARVHVW